MASTSTDGRIAAFDEIALTSSISDSTPMQKPCYDVFINHRGPDVKESLATTIYNVLKENNVTAFLDSKELELGDFLPETLEATMRTASIHIAIFSQNYASSPWCLAELAFMLTTGAKIIPVFYHVQPNEVRYVAEGKGIYVDAFEDYEMKGRYSPEKLQQWKMALKKASFYDGEIITNNEDEMRLLKKIVDIALKIIKNVPLVVANHPVGLEEIKKDFEMNTLQSGHAVQIVGIWGMGGSGKTTLAKYLYNKKYPSIEKSIFIFDVRDSDHKGMLHTKQMELLRGLGIANQKFDSIEQGKAILTNHLRSVRVLIVLDDVDSVDQLDALLPLKDSLGEGSFIIVTTREYGVLTSQGISSVYKMRALDQFYAEQLFCQHAFSKPVPLDGFENLVERFLQACNGLPLSLKVFGGQLYMEFCKEYWESLLDKISRILPDDIKLKLRISYDALDYEEKEMFLDRACFFIGEDKSLAIEVWNESGWSGLYSWQKLFNKCLVELDQNNHIKMHDHLRDLGREIANQHFPYRLWSSQHIINTENQSKKITGIRRIKTIPSNMITWLRPKKISGIRGIKTIPSNMIKISGIRGIKTIPSNMISWCSETRMSYPEMSNEFMANTIGRDWSLAPSLVGPKILVIRGDYSNKAIGEASRELVWLRWFEIGQRNLPSRLSLKNLRVLELYEFWRFWRSESDKHHLKELWGDDSDAPVQLRELVISYCTKFKRFPDSIGRLNVLKKIVVIKSKLMSLPEEFGRLQSLEYLQLRDCGQLSSLPDSFGNLRNLRFLDLSSCTELRMLPFSFQKLKLLQYLDLSGCGQLILRAEEFQNITKLEYANFRNCNQLQELPCHITNQASLRELYLDGTDSLRELPIDIGQLSMLQKMSIQWNFLTSLPTSIGNLSSLTNLKIFNCRILESLPTSLGDLSFLTTLEIVYCHNLKSLPTCIGDMFSLTNLSISNCSNLESLPTALGDLSSLRNLSISECSNLESLPTALGDLSSLRNLTIIECHKLKCLPLSMKRLNLLEHLGIRDCPIKVDFGAASFTFGLSNLKEARLEKTNVCRISMSEDRYPRLESLYLTRNSHLTEIEALPTTVKSIKLISCKWLKNIRVPCDLVNLEHLLIQSCGGLEELPSFARSTSLREFELSRGCYRVQRIEGLENCRGLERLRVETCWEVPGIQSLEHMQKLKSVKLRANKGLAIERCIQTMKKWPSEMQICAPAVPEASSLVDSLLSQNLVVDSLTYRSLIDRTFYSLPDLVNAHISNGDELLMLCFVMKCVTSQFRPRFNMLPCGGSVLREIVPLVENDGWVSVCVFAAGVTEECDITQLCGVEAYGKDGKMEKGLLVRGEEATVKEAFLSLLRLLQS